MERKKDAGIRQLVDSPPSFSLSLLSWDKLAKARLRWAHSCYTTGTARLDRSGREKEGREKEREGRRRMEERKCQEKYEIAWLTD